ncbi:transcriptional regulator (plasmid) [Sinorhizobium americanum CCGM7]|nr:transcriptional regulator [Sinorhizobium americanum CCGM7]
MKAWPRLREMESALYVVNGFRDRPAGTLKLNVAVNAARLVLPQIVPAFLAAYPDIRLEVIGEEGFVDVLAAGCDAGIRYDERLEQDMIAKPIGPRLRRFAAATSPAISRPARSVRASARICLAMPVCATAFPAA